MRSPSPCVLSLFLFFFVSEGLVENTLLQLQNKKAQIGIPPVQYPMPPKPYHEASIKESADPYTFSRYNPSSSSIPP
ncbi:hypothetical protein VN97_g7639 [Penicillium thymicola]|uniref:Transmembrane protein n=1 Tax=Penicillium thymicola TaxID=293382 RepID=A0AAI9TEN4_PENTH|nr:hypothetical protein VN97_g7639 [Penicillium thymicola]